MRLLSFSATNFRNLKNLKLSFDTPVTAFVGANAQGKTNILEAIYCLSISKSLRAESDRALIAYNEKFFRLTGEAINDSGEKIRLELTVTNEPLFQKNCKVNGRKVSASKFVGQMPAVFFQPEDLNLILLGPALRRRYLDILLAQISRDYLHACSGYTKALKNRNALLARIFEGRAKLDELDFWDDELARHGSLIGQKRVEFLEFATGLLAEKYASISGKNSRLTAKLTGFNSAGITPEKYTANLSKLREKDLRYGTTNYGPHRQDLSFSLDGTPVSDNGSRGEIRSTILALKLTELAFLEAKTGEKPFLLLDDVFSELDHNRQERLLELIEGYQTLITTTKDEHLEPIKEKKVWRVEGGRVN